MFLLDSALEAASQILHFLFGCLYNCYRPLVLDRLDPSVTHQVRDMNHIGKYSNNSSMFQGVSL